MNAGTRAQELIDLIVDEASGFDDVGRRIIANRIVGVLTGWLEQPKKDAVAAALPEPMTDEESKRYDLTRMEFGKHAGSMVSDVPLDYLAWLADASRKTWIDLWRYLHSPRVLRQQASEDEE